MSTQLYSWNWVGQGNWLHTIMFFHGCQMHTLLISYLWGSKSISRRMHMISQILSKINGFCLPIEINDGSCNHSYQVQFLPDICIVLEKSGIEMVPGDISCCNKWYQCTICDMWIKYKLARIWWLMKKVAIFVKSFQWILFFNME